MKKKVQTVEEMVMRSHYLNALDIESRAEKPMSEMERQDFINTINDLRETISSLQMTVKTLQKTIDDLNANEKRHKKEIDGLHEMLEFFKNQCEYLQPLNNRHNKQTYSGKSLSQKQRSENKKKGRDEKERDYTGQDKDNPEGGATAADNDVTTGVDPQKVKSEGLYDPRGERGSYNKMDAAKTHVRNRFGSAFLSAKDKIADWFVKKIAKVYRIENECILARKTPKEIWKRRNAKDVDKILKSLFTKASEYLNSKRRHFSKMTHDALKYMINGWEDLIRYREDGNYDIDNLAAERAIRPFTVHRKNAVSFGSEDGVKEACVFFTLCETCKQYGINFKEYITHVVKEIINGNTNYETLVPWAIKLA